MPNAKQVRQMIKSEKPTQLDLDAMELVLDLLRSRGVQSFKCSDFEVSFSQQAYLKRPLVDNTTKIDPPGSTKQTTNSADDDEDLLFYSSGK